MDIETAFGDRIGKDDVAAVGVPFVGEANILWGKTDSSDYKHYIFGLLFYKRICVWEEEYELRLAEFNNAELAKDPDEHRFDIPQGYFWKDIRKLSINMDA
jgi:type I restriction enzyme M protein